MHSKLGEGGKPLPQEVRNFYEPRFGYDFSNVRPHTDPVDAKSAQSINALAYTSGNNIVFNKGQYSPETESGKRLLGHELTHTIQQASAVEAISRCNDINGHATDVPVIHHQVVKGIHNVARQAAPFRTRTFQDRSGGGTTDFIETVQNAPTQNGTIISGRVDRSEVAPATGTTLQQTISTGHVNVQFDTSTCQLTLPYNFDFHQVPTANTPFCQGPPNATAVQPLPASDFQALRARYIRYVNDGLNGLFTARITGCQQSCADRSIPIRINAQDNPSSPDKVMDVVNRAGRGNAGTICVEDMTSGFGVHESGHQILGLGDEYRETDPTLRQRVPTWARDERVRTDLTRMGSEGEYGGFSLFHQRHFRFAQVFLEAAFPGCTVTLEEVPRLIPDFRISFDMGYARISGGNALTFGGGFDVGLPLTRLRQLELLLGARGRYLLETAGQYRSAFMVGVQTGIEARTSPGDVAATFSLFGGGGAYHQFGSSSSRFPAVPERTSPYVEGGGSVGVSSGMLGSGVSLSLRLEAAAGTEITNDPDAMRWFRTGLRGGIEW